MAKFRMKETIPTTCITARLGAGTGSSNWIDDDEVGKAVKLGADSRYILCTAGDPIQGFIASVETATADNYSIGSVQLDSRMRVLLDGSEAAGTGSIAVNDYVVAGTMVAKGTALTLAAPQKVRKATNQPGATIVTSDATKTNIDVALAAVTDTINNMVFAWRVVSLEGDGSVGTIGVIERVSTLNK